MPARHNIEWNYEYEYTFTTDTADTWKNKKTPRFLHQDPVDNSRMYLLGRHYGKASVMRFNKRTFARDWRTAIIDAAGDINQHASVMHDILSYVQPPNQDFIYGCGFAFYDSTQDSVDKFASMFKMSTFDGRIMYIKRWGQAALQATDASFDVCRSIAYDEPNKHLILMLETVSANLRPNLANYATYSAKNSDMLIIKMQDDGIILSALNVNMGDAAITMGVGE